MSEVKSKAQVLLEKLAPFVEVDAETKALSDRQIDEGSREWREVASLWKLVSDLMDFKLLRKLRSSFDKKVWLFRWGSI